MEDEVKILGLIFYKKLNFSTHIEYLKKKCQKARNILQVVGHTGWGADKTTLRKLYRTLVRSKLDYGSVICGSAKKKTTYFKRNGPNTHSGSVRCLGSILNIPNSEPLCGGGGAVTKT